MLNERTKKSRREGLHGASKQGLHDAAGCVGDTGQLRDDWTKACAYFTTERRVRPQPVWVRRPYEFSGDSAWDVVSADVTARPDGDAISIYIHLPFCEKRCLFCDCYSLEIGGGRSAVTALYMKVLAAEMESWSEILNLGRRKVTTVHFGGGTPGSVGDLLLGLCLERLRALYRVSGETELAIESTSSLLTEDHLGQLRDWGFSKIHVGVQTLTDEVRAVIGRKQESKAALQGISRALRHGFAVTADTIVGLPGDSPHVFADTIDKLIDAGVTGMSVYTLHVTDRNRGFVTQERDGVYDPVEEYLALGAAEAHLFGRGFVRNHFDHFSLPEDRNLYSTHRLRDEDLLALGATADGVLARFRYRHPDFWGFVGKPERKAPSLEGGMWNTAAEERARTAAAALINGTVAGRLFREIQADYLRAQWSEHGLLRQQGQDDEYTLTTCGSWFLGLMMDQLRAAAEDGNDQ